MRDSVAIIFPNQLFDNSDLIRKNKQIILVEEYLFFKQFNFHKQKILFHRISMKKYETYLSSLDKKVTYIDSTHEESDIRTLIDQLENIDDINIYDPVDYWLSKRIFKHADKKKINVNIHANPLFITSDETLN